MAKVKKADAEVPDGEVSPVPPDGPAAPAGDGGAGPKFGTPVPAPAGALPRVVSELTRAPKGGPAARFKVRCKNYDAQPTRYVLAASEDDARACYLAAVGLDRAVARLQKAAGAKADEVELPDLVVTRLAD